MLANEFNRFFTSVGRATIDKNNSRVSKCNYDHSKQASVARKHPEANQFSFKLRSQVFSGQYKQKQKLTSRGRKDER